MEKKFFTIIDRKTPKEILSGDDMEGTFSSLIVHTSQIYEIELKRADGCTRVSLLTDKESFDKCIDENQLLVISTGWWNTLAHKNVSVYTEKTNQKLLALSLF